MTESADTPAVDPFVFAAPLSVCLDVTHPLTFLALGPVAALADDFGIDIDWLPFPAAGLRPPPPASGTRDGDRGARHRRVRALYQASEIERYAEAQGIRIREPFRDIDGRAAGLGHLWLRGRAPGLLPGYLRRLCEGLWSADLDVADVAVVADLIADVGEEPAAFRAFAAGPGPDALDRMRTALVAAGVFTVPSLVVEGEVFVGRAHLPMVRWLLGGRVGPAPI